MNRDASAEPVARSVVDALLLRVFDGTYGPGARLPSERALAAELGVARVSVRDALGVLGGWRMVETLRGSGAVITPRRAWTSDALAAAMSFELRLGHVEELTRMVEDALALRRSLVLDMLERAAAHLQPGGLDRARAALEKAVSVSADRIEFLRADREVLPLVLEAAQMFPSLWLLNSLAAPYLAVMAELGGAASLEPAYRRAHLETFDALEAGDGARARARFARHLDVADRMLVDALPGPLAPRLARKRRRP